MEKDLKCISKNLKTVRSFVFHMPVEAVDYLMNTLNCTKLKWIKYFLNSSRTDNSVNRAVLRFIEIVFKTHSRSNSFIEWALILERNYRLLDSFIYRRCWFNRLCFTNRIWNGVLSPTGRVSQGGMTQDKLSPKYSGRFTYPSLVFRQKPNDW